MDPTRRLTLRSALEQELAETTNREGFNSLERIRWLSEHLEEYIERMVGFCALPDLTWQTLIASDGFAVIEVGADAITRELQNTKVSPRFHSAWQSFGRCLLNFRTSGNKQQVHELYDAARQVRSAASEPSESA